MDGAWFLTFTLLSQIKTKTMAANFRKIIKSFSPKVYWREILAVFMLLLAVVFFRSERKELNVIIPHIRQANPFWLLTGFS